MIQVANAPCSWGVLEFEDLAGQAAACQQVLSEMARAGYAGTELGDWGFMPTEPGPLREILEHHRLQLVGAFVPVALAHAEAHADGITAALRTARLVSQVAPEAFIVLSDDNGAVEQRVRNAGQITADQGLSPDQWDTFAAGAERLATAVLEETGLRTVFHHHCAGYVETPREVQSLLERTNPKLVGLCLDTGHYAYGGGDPLEALAHHGDRIWHVHFKDFDPDVTESKLGYFGSVERGVFCELGQGAIDFHAVLKQLHQTNYDGWIVVEQDVLPGMGAPQASAERSRAHLERLGI